MRNGCRAKRKKCQRSEALLLPYFSFSISYFSRAIYSMVPESTASTFRQNRYSPYTLYDTCLFLRTNTTPRGSKPNGVQCCFHSKKRQIQQTTQALNIYANEQTAKAKRAYSYNSAIVSLGTKIRRITEKLLFFAYICTRRGGMVQSTKLRPIQLFTLFSLNIKEQQQNEITSNYHTESSQNPRTKFTPLPCKE